MKFKVYWEFTQAAPGEYYEDDDGRELQGPMQVTHSIEVQERDSFEIEEIFEEQDADYDWSRTILYITDEKGRILWRRDSDPVDLTSVWPSYDAFQQAKSNDKIVAALDLVKALEDRQKQAKADWDRRKQEFIQKYSPNEDECEARFLEDVGAFTN